MSSKMRLAMLVAAGIVVFAGLIASAAERSNRSAVGTWKLDVAKSSYKNLPTPAFEQLVVTTDDADALKWSLVGTDGRGKTYSSSYDGPIDGQDHPLTSSEVGSMIAYTRTPSDGLRWVIKDTGGNVVKKASGFLSPDGKTLTIKGTANVSGGGAIFMSVFEKVK
jgi:hypothetical protein